MKSYVRRYRWFRITFLLFQLTVSGICITWIGIRSFAQPDTPMLLHAILVASLIVLILILLVLTAFILLACWLERLNPAVCQTCLLRHGLRLHAGWCGRIWAKDWVNYGITPCPCRGMCNIKVMYGPPSACPYMVEHLLTTPNPTAEEAAQVEEQMSQQGL